MIFEIPVQRKLRMLTTKWVYEFSSEKSYSPEAFFEIRFATIVVRGLFQVVYQNDML